MFVSWKSAHNAREERISPLNNKIKKTGHKKNKNIFDEGSQNKSSNNMIAAVNPCCTRSDTRVLARWISSCRCKLVLGSCVSFLVRFAPLIFVAEDGISVLVRWTLFPFEFWRTWVSSLDLLSPSSEAWPCCSAPFAATAKTQTTRLCVRSFQWANFVLRGPWKQSCQAQELVWVGISSSTWRPLQVESFTSADLYLIRFFLFCWISCTCRCLLTSSCVRALCYFSSSLLLSSFRGRGWNFLYVGTMNTGSVWVLENTSMTLLEHQSTIRCNRKT